MAFDETALREELARLDAEIVVFERIDTLSEQARRDLDARRAQRDQLAAALAALRG